MGWESVDFYGQTGHRSYEERQDNPGDWEAWTSQGPMNIHQREYLGKTDEGIALLRSRLKRDIHRVREGKSLLRPNGVSQRPIPTYGGDTVLHLKIDPKDDATLMASVIDTVIDIHIAASDLDDDARVAKITREVNSKYPGAL